MERIKATSHCLSIWLLIILIFAPLSYSSNFLQENQASNRVARKTDEYRVGDLAGHDEQMRLWSAFDDFAREPEESQLFIIAYGDLPGRGRRHANRAKNYLVNNHGINPARIVARDGGRRAETSVEIWIVPAGVQMPIPTPNGTFEQNVGAAWKYDEFSLDGWWFGDVGSCCERQPERLDGFAAILQANPHAKGYIIVRRGTIYCETCLRPGAEFRFAQRERDYLTRTRRIAPSRAIVMHGDRIGGGGIELWVVPNGARLPRVNHRARSRR